MTAVGLRFAKAHFDSLHGRISSSWRYEGDALHYEASTPPGTTILFQLPLKEGQVLTSDGKPIKTSSRFSAYQERNGMAIFRAPCGSYNFRIE